MWKEMWEAGERVEVRGAMGSEGSETLKVGRGDIRGGELSAMWRRGEAFGRRVRFSACEPIAAGYCWRGALTFGPDVQVRAFAATSARCAGSLTWTDRDAEAMPTRAAVVRRRSMAVLFCGVWIRVF
jgi:hypothetical protein